MTDEHRPEKPPEHRPEDNQQTDQTEHRPDNYLDPDLAQMYKDSEYMLDADSLLLEPEPMAPGPPIPDPGPRIASDQANPNQSRLGVADEVSLTEEAKGTAYDSPDPNATVQPRADASDAHQYGGFHPSYESQWSYGEVGPTEEAEGSGWPYGETNPTVQASFLEQSDASTGLGGLVDLHLTEDPNMLAQPEVPEQEDFFEGV